MKMKFAWTTQFLLVLLVISVRDSSQQCSRPCSEYRLKFQSHTTTDYAKKENSISSDLSAVTVCLFARDTDDNKPSPKAQTLYSYRTQAKDNMLNLATTPTIRFIVNQDFRDSGVGIDYGKWTHVCATWSNTGDYKIYKNGVVVKSGSTMSTVNTISSGGTTVIGQEQDALGGGFDVDQSFVGDVTEVNVWGYVLSASEIVDQYQNCHVPEGTVNAWSQFKTGVHGNVVVVEPLP